ncbi:hypothetical protein [Lacticaseibacillus mingshuiensis]|uniref:Lipoprotein n=1 Tax=Lacticaseibacillus mingshuiensis TaxID=2799574 RepID=A0ABW4CGA4_9LACO|nr:hypothetical protein [Lacticaseibacillus mingshuiensis]
MKKQKILLAATAGLLFLLAGCGQKLDTSKTTYQQDGMVAVIKGSASGHKTVSYQADTTSGTAKINSGSYVISIPTSTKAQQVKLTAGDTTKTVTVKAAKSLGTYSKVAATFNQAIIATALPKSVQAQLKSAATAKQPTKAELAAMTEAQRAALVKTQTELKAAMDKATAATKDQQLPTSVDGLKQVLKTTGGTVRVNVQDGQLMSAVDIVPIKALKDKKLQEAFGVQFGVLANAVGADATKVGKKFQDATKNANSSSTTIDTIVSNGVKFDVGYSTTELYIYLTK